MGEISYAPLINDMVWSYSRVKAFDDCPYRWYLKYIKGVNEERTFFADYGTFMHKIIDLYYKGNLTPQQMLETYLLGFKSEIVEMAPSYKIFKSYFEDGFQYIENFKPMPFKTIGTEVKMEFNIDGVPMIGYIDYIGSDNGELVIVDNKSRVLKPRSNRAIPTKMDNELDDYLKQLYLYSAAVFQKHKRFPKMLCFNCFRAQTLIREPFKESAYLKTLDWLKEKVCEITNTTDFNPNEEWFRCRYLCECKGQCKYFEEARK